MKQIVFTLLAIVISGCASQSTAILDYDTIADEITITHSIRIPATGEYCVIEGDKIISCQPSEVGLAETEE